jgi:hypothetical protein
MSPAVERFLALLKISDELIDDASKDELADLVRVLALNIAQYRAQFGEIPVRDSLSLLLETKTLADAQATALADGFEVLITVMKALATPAGEH